MKIKILDLLIRTFHLLQDLWKAKNCPWRGAARAASAGPPSTRPRCPRGRAARRPATPAQPAPACTPLPCIGARPPRSPATTSTRSPTGGSSPTHPPPPASFRRPCPRSPLLQAWFSGLYPAPIRLSSSPYSTCNSIRPAALSTMIGLSY